MQVSSQKVFKYLPRNNSAEYIVFGIKRTIYFGRKATIICIHPERVGKSKPLELEHYFERDIQIPPPGSNCGTRPLKSTVQLYPYTFCDGMVLADDPKCPPDYALCGVKVTSTGKRHLVTS
jgi:hypothetical protein